MSGSVVASLNLDGMREATDEMRRSMAALEPSPLVRLHPLDIERIAQRVVELLRFAAP